jgi:hypothetical protein
MGISCSLRAGHAGPVWPPFHAAMLPVCAKKSKVQFGSTSILPLCAHRSTEVWKLDNLPHRMLSWRQVRALAINSRVLKLK